MLYLFHAIISITSTYTLGLGSGLGPLTASSFNSHLSCYSFPWPGSILVVDDIISFFGGVDIISFIKSKYQDWSKQHPCLGMAGPDMHFPVPSVLGPKKYFISHLLFFSCPLFFVATKLQLTWLVVYKSYSFDYQPSWWPFPKSRLPWLPLLFFLLRPCFIFFSPYRIVFKAYPLLLRISQSLLP